jgi:uncharacterized protein YndB with AHSA1/START domain
MSDTAGNERFEVKLAIDISAGVDKVWQALTNWQQLNGWLTDKADVDLAAGRFQMCGRHLPDSPCDGTDRFSLDGYSEGTGLQLNWQYRDEETKLAISLTETEEGCHVELAHTNVPRRGKDEITMIEYWQWVLLALRGYCENGSRPSLHDFSAIQAAGRLEVSIDISAPVEAVYQQLATTDGLKSVFGGDDAAAEMQPGGKYSYGWGPSEGPTKVIEFTPNELIHTDWYHKDDPETFITWKLEGSGGRTRLTMIHSGFADEKLKQDYEAGWFHFLVELRELAEGNFERKVEVLAKPDGWAV